DIIVVNKADGPNVANAAKAKKQIEIALHLFPSAISGWGPKVLVASGIQNEGVKESWEAVMDRDRTISESGWMEENRKSQQFRAFQNLAEQAALQRFLQQVDDKVNLEEIRLEIENAESNEFEAVLKLLDSL
ncbi:MAG TPA: methylmalonyl Co-A mutase-associated GTPase MeaB, partial [Flavobacteriales bacterium]|nr:methylmalonyl Co-A mutase-associated GTPase MeaB [Flavobacteriales bacterium]